MAATGDTLALAEEAVIATYPLYEMCRMRAATSPRRTDGHGVAPEGQRWCNVFTHARELLRAEAGVPSNNVVVKQACAAQ